MQRIKQTTTSKYDFVLIVVLAMVALGVFGALSVVVEGV